MYRRMFIAGATCALMLFSGSAAALEWHKHSGDWGGVFYVYTATRGNDEIRFGLENISNRTIDVGAIYVEYQCKDGSTDEVTHYFSHTYPPGHKRAFVGFDSVCENQGGFSRWTITSCETGNSPCF